MSNYKIVIIITFILVFFGLSTLFSASFFTAYQNSRFHNNPYFFLKRQLMHLVLGFIFFMIALKFKISYFKNIGPLLIFISLILLVLVLFIGSKQNGAKRWISIAGKLFQPSDFAEASVIIYLSFFLAKIRERTNKQIIITLFMIFLMIILILIEPNISSAFLLLLLVFVLLYISDIERKYIFIPLLTFVPIFIFAIFKYKHAIVRILAFINKTHASVQTQSSLLALGNGGIWGAGLGLGKIKLLYLPEAYSDFIFATIGEELGIFGSFIILLLYFLLFKNGLKIAQKSVLIEYKILAFSIALLILSKTVIHIAISVKLLPTTGIGLPLISYGGSSLIVTLFLLGLLANIGERIK